ncbi:MAG: YqhA family protein [Methanomicrobiales archaeon]|nr:YqhA family protein [Methanomicrobiales archaeon]
MIVFIRSLIIITIVALLLGAVIVVAGGIAELYQVLFYLVGGGIAEQGLGKYLAVNMTELIDLFLIAIVLIIIALGLFQLFINPDIDLPDWLNTSSLESLKIRLLVVIVVLLSVIFLGAVAESEGGIAIAGLGIGVAAVIFAIGYILSIYIRTSLAKADRESRNSGQEKESAGESG